MALFFVPSITTNQNSFLAPVKNQTPNIIIINPTHSQVVRAQFGAEELVGNLAQVANNLAHTSQVRMQNQHSLEDKQVAQFTAVKERFHGQDKEINNIKVNQNALKSELAATHNTLAEMMHNYVREQLPSVLPRSIARTTTPKRASTVADIATC